MDVERDAARLKLCDCRFLLLADRHAHALKEDEVEVAESVGDCVVPFDRFHPEEPFRNRVEHRRGLVAGEVHQRNPGGRHVPPERPAARGEQKEKRGNAGGNETDRFHRTSSSGT